MIALLGYGKTTQAIAKRVKEAIFFADTPLPKAPYPVLPTSSYDPKKFSLAIASPGLPPSHPLIRRSKKLLSDYDYFYETFPFTIWVSGTNGKTTTTQMLTHLLSDKGAISGGNIGTPVASLDPKAPIWILETSSFTLHYTHKAKPNLYILLPITPDHISWHGSFQAYEEAKLSPIKRLKEGEIAIVPKRYLHTPTKGFLIGYEGAADIANYFGIDEKSVAFKGPFLLDALLALAATKILFNTCDYDKINAFCVDAHKQEEFYDAEGRLWVDDSKATNIDASLQAIKRYGTKELHLILGGDNKGVSLLPLLQKLPPQTTIYAIGKAAPQIIQEAKEAKRVAKLCHTLEKAVEMIRQSHHKESIALLSPACASLDQFANYKERGEMFKKLVLRKN